MKETLILLHGALGAKEQLLPIKNLLLDQFDVHVMEFEGHGKNLSNKSFSIALFVDNLLDYLRENDLEKVKVFGYSMGGYVALSAAAKEPERFSKILTLGTKFEWSPSIASGEVKMLNPDIIEEKVPVFARRLAQLHGESNWKNVMLKTADMMLKMGDGQRTKDEVFGSVETPTVVGIGDKDKMVSQEESKKYANIIKAKYVVLENIPHPIDMIAADRIKDYILNQL